MGPSWRRNLFAAFLVGCVAANALAQEPPLSGRWAASQADRGVTVALDLGSPGKLVVPGTGPSGRTEALSLNLREVKRAEGVATFIVDLPDGEGVIDFEFTASPNGESGLLRVRRIEGEPPDDDLPTWRLTRVR
jgi:hypothetical protein